MKNKALVFVAVAALLASGLSGCGKVSRASAGVLGVSKVCVSGVTYLQFTSGAAVMVDRSGKPVPC